MFKVWADKHLAVMLTDFWLLTTLVVLPGESCGPGRSYFHTRRAPRKMTPLVYKQHSPNLNENTLGASGPAEGRISRIDPEFKNLITNGNPDIVFKDEEATGADRKMSQRCSEKLNALAILVMQRWPGIKVRVTEAWDEDGFHPEDSLHYEGRAVDITTSDRDRTKYGMLARLAIEAGFDWVHYEARGHVHCSVKSDSSLAIAAGGCFPSTSTVFLEDWTEVKMSDLHVGAKVWTLDVSDQEILAASSSSSSDGRLVLTEVVTFLHKEPDREMEFSLFAGNIGEKPLVVSSNHLVYVAGTNNNSSSTVGDIEVDLMQSTFSSHLRMLPVFAASVRYEHHELVTVRYDNRIRLSRVMNVTRSRGRGVYAPLTTHGTILVDGYLVSCYATISDHRLAHDAMAPLRAWLGLTKWTQCLSASFGDFLENVGKMLKNFIRSLITENLPKSKNEFEMCSVVTNCTHSFENLKENKSLDPYASRNISVRNTDPKAVHGVHPYADFLYWIAKLVLDKEMLFRV